MFKAWLIERYRGRCAVVLIASVLISSGCALVTRGMTQVDIQVDGTVAVREQGRAPQVQTLTNRSQPLVSPYLSPVSVATIRGLQLRVDRVHDVGVNLSIKNESASQIRLTLLQTSYRSIAGSTTIALAAQYWVEGIDEKMISNTWTQPRTLPSVLLPGQRLHIGLSAPLSPTTQYTILGLMIDQERSKITASSVGHVINAVVPVEIDGIRAELEFALRSVAEYPRQVYR